MDLIEASYFYGDFRLLREIYAAELCVDFDDTNTREEISTCDRDSDNLQ